MSKQPEHDAGRGLDKPNPRTMVEKLTVGLKKIMSNEPTPAQKPGTGPATIIPPAD